MLPTGNIQPESLARTFAGRALLQVGRRRSSGWLRGTSPLGGRLLLALIVGLQFASFLIVFIEDPLKHGVRRPVEPGIIVFVIVQADGNDDARPHIGATPLSVVAVKLQTDAELFVFHKRQGSNYGHTLPEYPAPPGDICHARLDSPLAFRVGSTLAPLYTAPVPWCPGLITPGWTTKENQK
jgi:hypothetical protein